MPWHILSLKTALEDLNFIIFINETLVAVRTKESIHLIIVLCNDDILLDNINRRHLNIFRLVWNAVNSEDKACIERTWLMSDKFDSHFVFHVVIQNLKYFDLNLFAFEIVNQHMVDPLILR